MFSLSHRVVLIRLELSKMARPLGIRQQALATAQVYVRRFYLKIEIRRTNPALVLATALYLACKMEECPQHIRMILAEARHCWGKSHSCPTPSPV
jgi:cyclin C